MRERPYSGFHLSPPPRRDDPVHALCSLVAALGIIMAIMLISMPKAPSEHITAAWAGIERIGR